MRSYEDPCGIARALDLIGERWALLIVRELVLGPKRFTDLKAGLVGASPNVLSQRLRELESGGVIRRQKVGAPTYELTDWGRELHPLLLQLGRWGARSSLRPKGPMSVDALLVALEATFVVERAAGLSATYELRLGEERFSAEVDAGALAIIRGAPRKPDAVITTDAATLRALVFGDLALDGAPVELQGDKRVARAFFRLFSRPPMD
ncbi:winged helix-turn-helix transcriptional regulator [Pyxidicoccus xibeiensis]|uniref:winged helix-turn-helix transcriptional regulator n=1 Tax=Pyxidicoccus xibeiensis TaxID=2906759 RepID=UPI0020A75966|nr:helix-turn-helix domain-containing protein [Pyxidicoccus xibeiensis]MCP3140832.1 helix-turn-helix transcriptional regulator [Pyxidicoccus xibeiensis]